MNPKTENLEMRHLIFGLTFCDNKIFEFDRDENDEKEIYCLPYSHFAYNSAYTLHNKNELCITGGEMEYNNELSLTDRNFKYKISINPETNKV